MRMQSAGIDLSAVIAAACRYLGMEEKEMARLTKRIDIAPARALISYVATQILSISGNELARRFNVGLSAIRRTTQRVSRDTRNCLQPPKRYKENSISIETNIECPLYTLVCVHSPWMHMINSA